jgi:hypothetical protein
MMTTIKSHGLTFEIGHMASQTLMDGTYVPSYYWIGASDAKGNPVNIGFNPKHSTDDAVAWIKANAARIKKEKAN